MPRALLDRDAALPVEEMPELRPLLVDAYRHHPEVMQVCERLVDLDEGLQEWRYRHVKMVERTIGSKTGELAVIQRVVRIKEELEKIREQVQNLE